MHRQLLWPMAALLLLLAGCSAPPSRTLRYLLPTPPDEPRIEWLGTYASQDDFTKTSGELAMESILGKPPLERFMGPYGIAADGAGKVFITDVYLQNIRVYDLNRRKVEFFLREPILQRPYYLAIDSQKQLYVADAMLKKVLVFSPGATLVKTYGNKDELTNPVYVEVDEKQRRLYISDSEQQQIHVYGLDDGRHLFAFGKGVLLGPQGVAIGPNGHVYVADTLNALIRVFDAEGKLLRSFGERNDTQGGMEHPKDLAFDSEGNLWLVDYRKPVLRAFAPDGTFLFVTGGPVTHKMGFGTPSGIYISPEDDIFIVDFITKRFSHWRYLSKAALARHPVTAEDLEALRGGGSSK